MDDASMGCKLQLNKAGTKDQNPPTGGGFSQVHYIARGLASHMRTATPASLNKSKKKKSQLKGSQAGGMPSPSGKFRSSVVVSPSAD